MFYDTYWSIAISLLWFLSTTHIVAESSGRCTGYVDCGQLTSHSTGDGVCQSCIGGQCNRASDCAPDLLKCRYDFQCETIPGCYCEITSQEDESSSWNGFVNQVIQCGGGNISGVCENLGTETDCKQLSGCEWDEDDSGNDSLEKDGPWSFSNPACSSLERAYTESFSDLDPFCKCAPASRNDGGAEVKATCMEQCERCNVIRSSRGGNIFSSDSHCALSSVTNYYTESQMLLGNWSVYTFGINSTNQLKLELYRHAQSQYRYPCALRINGKQCYSCKTVDCYGSPSIEANCSGIHPGMPQEVINTCSGTERFDTFPYFATDQSHFVNGTCHKLVGGPNDISEVDASTSIAIGYVSQSSILIHAAAILANLWFLYS